MTRALLTKKEAAAYLRVSPRTITNLVSRGVLHVVRVTRNALFYEDALAALVASRESVGRSVSHRSIPSSPADSHNRISDAN
jgi:excisionase family DNA binding protein